MTKIGNRVKLIFLISLQLFLVYPYPGHCLTLITPEEAAQPDTLIPRGLNLRTVERDGPQIKVYSPNLDEPLQIPFILDITFESSSDKTINFNSLSIKYLKLISIDLTDKIKPYLSNNRLIIKDAKVPQGKHRLQFSIAYTSGEKTIMEIILNVEK